jgi:uncharacterized protein
MNLNNLIEDLQQIFSNDFSGHDIDHIFRVFKLSEFIAKKENIEFNIKIQLLALLHDVDDWKLEHIKNKNVSNLEYLSNKYEIIKDNLKFLVDNIPLISFKGNTKKNKLPIEVQIVQDADRLDALGAIGIARAFSYGATKKRKMFDPNILPKEFKDFEDYKNNQSTTINHFYEKLLKLKDLMNTKTAKELAEKRHNYMLEYLGTFFDEWYIIENIS